MDAAELQYPVCDFDPILIHFPEWMPLPGVRWYGLAYVMGFVVGALLLRLYFKRGRSPLNPEQQMSLMTYIIIGTLVGGRLGYMLLYTPGAFFSNPLSFFKVWEGGMASHGGFVGIYLGVLLFSRKVGQSFWKIADITVTLAPAGILFGRVANFINGELWGKIAEVPWAFIFPKSMPEGTPLVLIPPRHPSQLYEAFFEGLVLLVYLQARFWLTDPKKRAPGSLLGEFFMVYAVGRVISELFREPDEGISLILGLSRGTFYSVLTFAFGLGVVLYAQARKRRAASV
ncbi:prolipoprotein diacylglyceryl transferase [Ruficoccus amylovorans]|uniref:Phosphatidylglycerol--prolipoprotein diacylglyceryl transferase n=1 Tax=Ruficoccus amylovorans TaxID=1804625 RepID=A0A842HI72_9BACT|nr:prolipoprotein diacylglyceryl transferase [Ruficoccus amylovorans]MBC2596112.1 prolipoprotein diacylglyceryl transferase [Ruficoccus amylovorans]